MTDMSDWVEKYDEKRKRTYWRNKKTRKAQWTNPFMDVKETEQEGEKKDVTAQDENTEKGQDEEGGKRMESIDGWLEKFDGKKARKYWENEATGEIVWKNPNQDEHHHHVGADPTLAASIAAAAQGMSVSDCTSTVT